MPKVKNQLRKSHELPFLFRLIAMKKGSVEGVSVVCICVQTFVFFLSLLSLLVVKGTELILIESFWFLSRLALLYKRSPLEHYKIRPFFHLITKERKQVFCLVKRPKSIKLS